MERLKNGVTLSVKGGETFVCFGVTADPYIVETFLGCGWTISGLKNTYLKFEASGYQYCSNKVTWQSSINVDFDNLPNFFEVDKE